MEKTEQEKAGEILSLVGSLREKYAQQLAHLRQLELYALVMLQVERHKEIVKWGYNSSLDRFYEVRTGRVIGTKRRLEEQGYVPGEVYNYVILGDGTKVELNPPLPRS